ncbi:hypothetical protein CISIN_1g040941mg [Citrus sinensis]|uniref:HAT C-terminal dimerisation domain-containing protein n=1 Tax=Citrus sinensis TaxID=2711 RepID=A0A067DJM7_CITSI|nr:hypothetical protein CISIN_1g040941mg [Citrus sinensis]
MVVVMDLILSFFFNLFLIAVLNIDEFNFFINLAGVEALDDGELSSGRGLNQEVTLKRSVDTCWSSHYGTLLSIITMFPYIIYVLEIISNEENYEQRFQATMLLKCMQSFDFGFSFLVIISITKQGSRHYSLLGEISSYCVKHNIDVPNMDDLFQTQGRSQCKAQNITNLHRFCVELFYAILDMQLQELSNCFNETNTKLLLCVACLCPNDSFASFDKQKLLRLDEFNPNGFSPMDLLALETQLDVYITDVGSDNKFSGLKRTGELARKLVETKKYKLYSLVYLLVTLALILPVATTTVERTFSAMNFVKNCLRNRMRDQWLNDSLVVYIEKDIFCSIDNDAILQYFQHIKPR